MKIYIINISNKMPQWVITACDDYLKRINRGNVSCKIIEIKSEKIKSNSPLSIMEFEAKKIKSSIPNNSFVIALDEKGVNYTSQQFANKIEQINLHHSTITFLIGGANGLHDELKQLASLKLQLSSLTFPHAMVRVVILEQIYRAISIIENHPYHRD